jgi:DNA-binding transcriptional regulator YhcF (GntR family)
MEKVSIDKHERLLKAVIRLSGASRRELANATKLSTNFVWVALHDLEAAGLVVVTKGWRPGANGRLRTLDVAYATMLAYKLHPEVQYSMAEHADYVKVKEMLNTTTDSHSMIVRIYSFWYRHMYAPSLTPVKQAAESGGMGQPMGQDEGESASA